MKVNSQDDHWFCSLNLVASCENWQLHLGSFNVQYETCGLVAWWGIVVTLNYQVGPRKFPIGTERELTQLMEI